MRLEGEQGLCRFHLTNYAQVRHQPLYEWIVEQARSLGNAGATVLRGQMGYLLDGPLLVPTFWSMSHQVPVIVEVVDCRKKLARLMQRVTPELRRGLVTLERAHVVYYRSERASATTAALVLDAPEDAALEKGDPTMQLPKEGTLLRIFIGDADRDPATGKPLYEALVLRAREQGLAGATVLRGQMGFGKGSRMHTAKLLDLSTDLPVVIEIVDAEDRIHAFLAEVDQHVREGLVTLEKVQVWTYVADPAGRDERRAKT